MNSSDNDQLIREFNELKQLRYKTDGKGFNEDDGLFYTNPVQFEDSIYDEVYYRDESDNVSLHLIDERTKRRARTHYRRWGIPLNLDDPSLNNKKDGGGKRPRSNNDDGDAERDGNNDPDYDDDEQVDNTEVVSMEIDNDDDDEQVVNSEVVSMEIDRPEWDNLNLKQLKNILRKNGLTVSGNKSVLIQRLKDNNNINYNPEDIIPVTSTTRANKKTSTKNSTRKKRKVEKRKNTDYNAFELIIALILKHNVQNVDELYRLINNGTNVHNGIGIDLEGYNNYIIDLRTRPNNMVNEYITNFHNINNLIDINNVNDVKLEGKGGDKNEKSDVFFTYNNDITRYGVSVKQSKEATLSNYSVNLILNEITGSKRISQDLQTIKMKYIEEKGLLYNDKSHRALIGNLFHNHFENPYWNELRKVIENNSQIIADNILNAVLCVDTKTIVYEYDGSALSLFDKTCPKPNTSNIVEDTPYYFLKNRTPRKAAKMFYNIYIGSELKYRVEIRHKGSWSASPQFMLFKP